MYHSTPSSNANLPFADISLHALRYTCLGSGFSVWFREILTLQKRAHGLIFFANKRSHAIPLFVASNILPVNILYFETVSSIMHGVSIHSKPKNIRELFIHSSDVHAYNTRFSCVDNLFVQKSRLHMKLKSFPTLGTRLWSCLRPDWRKLTKRAFKRKSNCTWDWDYYVDAHSHTMNLNTSNYHTL